MEVYTVGKTNHVVGGHGDTYSETQINPLGMYGSDGFPPIFEDREEAEKFAKDEKYKWCSLEVIPLTYIGKKPESS